MYNQNSSQMGNNQHQHVHLQEGDLANSVLNELKRVAREYATACLEASNTDIRNLFEQLLHQTLNDQEYLYQTMGQLNLYGQPASAPSQELQKETQHHQQQLGKLQSFMQQYHRSNRDVTVGMRSNDTNQQQQQNMNEHIQQPRYQQQQYQQNQQNQQPNHQQQNMNQQIQQPQYQQRQQHLQHHSSSQPQATHETGSKSMNSHTSDNPFTQ